MTPGARPKQGLNEVVGLPDKPDGQNLLIEWKDPIPSKRYPKGTPRKLTFVCSVEWAWSPMNNRIANYYINAKPWRWALWDNWLDDHDVPWRWWWNFIAYSGKTGVDERTITAHMLLEAWRDDAEHQLMDHNHWINNTGCLSVEDVQAIAEVSGYTNIRRFHCFRKTQEHLQFLKRNSKSSSLCFSVISMKSGSTISMRFIQYIVGTWPSHSDVCIFICFNLLIKTVAI